MKFSLPANILLMGEYAILEEGGKGLSLAVDPRAYFEIKPSSRWQIIGLWGDLKQIIDPFKDNASLASLVFRYLRENYKELYFEVPHSIEIDTRLFFEKDGRKKGYGSSAVVALGITVALFSLVKPLKALSQICFFPAVKAHRFAQEGRGSGYDIATSLYGGMGIFIGGQKPSWRPIRNFSPKGFYLFQGEKPVKTLNSIETYQKHSENIYRQEWVSQNNALLAQFEKETTQEALLKILYKAGELGRIFSQKIGVSADLSPKDKLISQGSFVKALGAGNETFLFVRLESSNQFFSLLSISNEGLQWEKL